MANQRMYLLHKPSGLTIKLGKRMYSAPYYMPPSKEELQAFFDAAFDYVGPNGWDGHDVFEIAYEDPPNHEGMSEEDAAKWVYNPDLGISQRVDG